MQLERWKKCIQPKIWPEQLYPQFSAAAYPPIPWRTWCIGPHSSSWAGGLCRKSQTNLIVLGFFLLSTQKGLWLIIQRVFQRPCSESNICHLFKAHQLTGNQVTNTLWFHVSIGESWRTCCLQNRAWKSLIVKVVILGFFSLQELNERTATN